MKAAILIQEGRGRQQQLKVLSIVISFLFCFSGCNEWKGNIGVSFFCFFVFAVFVFLNLGANSWRSRSLNVLIFSPVKILSHLGMLSLGSLCFIFHTRTCRTLIFSCSSHMLQVPSVHQWAQAVKEHPVTDFGTWCIHFPSAGYSVTVSHFLSNPHRLGAVRTCWETR